MNIQTIEGLGYKILITEYIMKDIQRRTHKKKRINKKYAKKYGYKHCGLPIPDGKIYEFAGKLYMNRATYLQLTYSIDPRWANG